MWHYSSQRLCIAACREERPRTWKRLRHRTFGERWKLCLLGRGKAQPSPGWEGQAAGRRGPRFFTKFDLQAFIFMHVWTCGWSSRRIHETSHLPELVWPSSERPGLGCCVPCHWGPIQNKAIRPAATRRLCPEFPPECKPALLSLNSIFTYHLQLFQPAVLALLLVTAAPNFRGNALVNFAWSGFWMAWNVFNVFMCI